MPTHFLDLQGACTLITAQYQLVTRIIDDLVEHAATGVIHGPAGVGKTFAVDANLERLRDTRSPRVTVCSLAFPSKPTMRRVAADLVTAVSGTSPADSRSRFDLMNYLIGMLAIPQLIVIDEAQRLNGECIEMLRHLHDHPATRFALLYVGGDGCWEVLSREPMLRSRIFRRLPFTALPAPEVPALMRSYHPIYTDVSTDLLELVDDSFAHGSLRNWAVFTHTAARLCTDAGRDRLDPEVVRSASTLLGGGVTR
jgi:type II secretory pathway predicted ATPase ExeA